MKKALLLLLCLLLLGTTGCAAVANPLERAEATPVPGLPHTLHPAKPSDQNADKLKITLFYRYMQTDMLGCETRTITVPRDETPEMATVRQLLAGPQASHTELTRLFPHTTSVLNVNAVGDTLYVTLSEDLLNDGIPEAWRDDPVWKREAPLRRQLTLQSLVATITENFPYPYVQIMLSYNQTRDVSTRLEASYFLKDGTGPAPRLTRQEEHLLTMQNTALLLLQAWQTGNYELLYTFTADQNASKPPYNEFVKVLDGGVLLTAFAASGGHVSGQQGTVTLSIDYLLAGQSCHCPAYPLRLITENEVWKVPYEELQRLMLQKN